MNIEAIIQPNKSTTLAQIKRNLSSDENVQLDVAVAYITSSGLKPFLRAVSSDNLGTLIPQRMRWITSFDYLRTDPAALAKILELDSRRIRIVDGQNSISRKCRPLRPFHPKVFMFDGKRTRSVIAGSGNLSYSGLSRGHEAGLVLRSNRKSNIQDKSALRIVGQFSGWFNRLWQHSDVLTQRLLLDYQEIYDSSENLSHPNVTEDDVLPENEVRGGLSLEDLTKLRACRRFWVQERNVTKNRGPNLRGNQIMLKRMSRVFFGVPALNVSRDTPLKDLKIEYESEGLRHCTLSFSNNSMDKLTLPIPGDGGPQEYDDKCLLFERRAPDQFALRILNKRKQQQAVAASKKINAYFKFKSGREWGVY